MYLRKTKTKNGRIYLSIAQAYRRDNGTSTSKTIESLGYLDELEKQFDDPITHFKEVCEQLNKDANEKKERIILEFFPKQKIDMKSCNKLELGAAIPSAYFHHDLGIWKFFENKRTSRTSKFDPCRILELLVWDRIAHPSSKLEAWQNKDKFPRKCNFSIHDVYRSLTYLQDNAAELVKAMNTSYEKTRGKRNKKRLYYDVTNYYFEIENEDELRKRGVSKEHRPNPIVQMGLLLDGDGIPLDYEIFSGNTVDMLTMMPVMKKANLKDKTKKERFVIVADKGLNTSNNIAACTLDGNGFIFSQSVRKADCELKEWVVDQKDYTNNSSGTFKIKSRIVNKTISIKDVNGKTKKVEIPVKQVAFWSKDFFLRSRHERAKVIEKSTQAILRGDQSSAHAHSKIRYVKDVPCNKTTGELASHNWILNQEKIEEDEALDGYYCIITSELNMDDREVIESYRGLSRIEESFRVMKTDFDARPVYCSTEDHIKAHFLICYIALFIMRLMQIDTKWKYSARTIANEIKEVVGYKTKQNYYMLFYTSKIILELSKKVGIDFNSEIISRGEIRKIMADVKK